MPIQIIHSAQTLKLGRIDLSELQPAVQQAELERIARTEVMVSFDLARDPLWRAVLLRLSPHQHVLVLLIHHILSDAWSRAVIHQELSALYNAHVGGRLPSLAELPLQYADYAAWQRQIMEGEEGKQLQSYWLQQMRDEHLTLGFPTDRPRPPVQTHVGASKTLLLRNELLQKLKVLSHREHATLFMTLLCAFNVLLNRYSGQPDIVVGIPVSGRNRAEFEHMVGQFINILPIRTRLSADCSLRGLLSQVRDTCLAAFSHQDCPFDMIVSGLKLDRGLDHHPLFQVMFALEQSLLHDLELSGLRCKALNIGPRPMPYDLIMIATEEPEGINIVIDYNVDLFDAVTIERLAVHYLNLLEGMAATLDVVVSELPLLAESERRQLLFDWNRTERAYPRVAGVHELFECQAGATPDAVAAASEAGQPGYGQLNERANRLAHHLRGLGLERGTGRALRRAQSGHAGRNPGDRRARRSLCTAGPGLPRRTAIVHA
ncbi:MAG: hypothetical protein IPN40_14160 [Uliginosibacterium sp.]|nr:hypothetical protein [Uliginosibacterium sp.]